MQNYDSFWQFIYCRQKPWKLLFMVTKKKKKPNNNNNKKNQQQQRHKHIRFMAQLAQILRWGKIYWFWLKIFENKSKNVYIFFSNHQIFQNFTVILEKEKQNPDWTWQFCFFGCLSWWVFFFFFCNFKYFLSYFTLFFWVGGGFLQTKCMGQITTCKNM